MNKLYPVVQIVVLCLTFCLIANESFAKGSFKYYKIRQFIPEGFEVFDTASGDLNADGYTDYVLVLTSNGKNKANDGVRPLLVLMGKFRDDFYLFARKDKAVLCERCGGMFDDPYQKISIKESLISIEHNIGGTWRWSRTITFKYEAECKEIVLFNDVTSSYHASAPTKQTSTSSNKIDFGNLPFERYAYNKGF